MRILAADDEAIALDVLTAAIKEAEPEAEIVAFRSGVEVLEYLSANACDVCFLDIEMRDYNGLALALEAKKYKGLFFASSNIFPMYKPIMPRNIIMTPPTI